MNKQAVALTEVVPFSTLALDPFFKETHPVIPENTPGSLYILGEAGDEDFTPEQIDGLKKQSITVGDIDEEGNLFTSEATGYQKDGRMFVFPDPTLVFRAASVRIAEDMKDLTSLSMTRDKDVEKKKFLVELEASIFNDFNSVVKEAGVSRNLLVNMLIAYYLKNKTKLSPEVLLNE